jgi:hypothetical protein
MITKLKLGVEKMKSTTSNIKPKRLSKGQRLHIRRMKQEARKEGTVYRPQKVHRAPAKITEE